MAFDVRERADQQNRIAVRVNGGLDLCDRNRLAKFQHQVSAFWRVFDVGTDGVRRWDAAWSARADDAQERGGIEFHGRRGEA